MLCIVVCKVPSIRILRRSLIVRVSRHQIDEGYEKILNRYARSSFFLQINNYLLFFKFQHALQRYVQCHPLLVVLHFLFLRLLHFSTMTLRLLSTGKR